MKKENSVSALLGLSQKDLALLLNVSRGHLSMFESGKRKLPQHATILLAEMLDYVSQRRSVAKTDQPTEHQTKQQELHLSNMLRENEYQQQRLDKKVAALKRKQNTQKQLSPTIDFLKTAPSNNGKQRNELKISVAAKSNREREIDHNIQLLEFEIKSDVLQFEKTLLESKLKKTRSDHSDDSKYK